MVCLGVAGLGALVTLLMGVGTGREHLGFHSTVATLILVGWLCFLWTLLRHVRHGFSTAGRFFALAKN
ncbi:MAG: hypothetical protein ABGY71_07375 [bacterium]|nr:hypothetical protein [Planctomycetota bacterium]HIL52982.1 hypothetical protein [Planctomycetota bacterium]